MIPLRQTEPSSTTPIVTRALVFGNTALFIAQIILGTRTESLINTFGYIPARFMNPGAYGFTHFEVAVTLQDDRVRDLGHPAPFGTCGRVPAS